jgi:hypothetical protein
MSGTPAGGASNPIPRSAKSDDENQLPGAPREQRKYLRADSISD